MGTRFLVTRGCQAPEEYKQMLVDTTSLDIVYTPVISGVPANFLAPYLVCGPRGGQHH